MRRHVADLKTWSSIPPSVLLSIAGFAVYANSLSAPFIFDDQAYILHNPQIRHLWPLTSVLYPSSRPLVNLTLAINFAWTGLDPWSYHLTNVLIHVLAALTLAWLIRLTLHTTPLRLRYAAHANGVALSASLLWLLHPLQTASVTYTIQRAEALTGWLTLLTLCCVARSTITRHPARWMAAAVTACALGMASKPIMVTVPVLVFVYDRVFLAGSWKLAIQQRQWLYIGLAATWGVLVGCLASAPVEWVTAGFEQQHVSLRQYLATQPSVIAHYLSLALWPVGLALDYGWPIETAPGSLKLVLAGAGLVGTIIWSWRRPELGFLIAWCVLGLAPTSGLVPIEDPAFDHRMYLPLAPLMILLVMVIRAGLDRLPSSIRWEHQLATVMVVVTATALGTLTVLRNYDYRSDIAIWSQTAAVRPHNARAQLNLGIALKKAGHVDVALAHYREAIRLRPKYALALTNLGAALAESGDVDSAMIHLREAVQLLPELPEGRHNLGTALVSQNDVDGGLTHLREALRLRPHYAKAHYNVGRALAKLQQWEPATYHYTQAIRQEPGFALAYNDLGIALLHQGRVKEAIVQYEQALSLLPDFPNAHFNLGQVLTVLGRVEQALAHFLEVLRLQPDDADTQHIVEQLTLRLHSATIRDEVN